MRTLYQNNVKSVAKPTKNPVFIVTFTDDERIVVKYEAPANTKGLKDDQIAHNICYGAAVMRQVSPQIQAVPLKPAEVQVLQNLTTWRNAGMGAQTSDDVKQYIAICASEKCQVWFKMPFVDNLVNLAGRVAKEQKGRGILRSLRDDPSALKRLAGIAVADLFIGNCDRFRLTHDSELNKERAAKGIGRGAQFSAWTSVWGGIFSDRNFFFEKQGTKGKHTYTPVGLDWFTAAAGDAFLELDPSADWVGLVLAKDQELRVFAANAIDAINAYFNNWLAANPKFDKTQLLTPTHIETFAKGMFEYRNMLRTYFLGVERAQLPGGIQKRMALLGWVAWTAAKSSPPAKPSPSAPTRSAPKSSGNNPGWRSANPSNT